MITTCRVDHPDCLLGGPGCACAVARKAQPVVAPPVVEVAAVARKAKGKR